LAAFLNDVLWAGVLKRDHASRKEKKFAKTFYNLAAQALNV